MSAYIRWEGKNRETGTRTQVIDLLHADAEFDAERDSNGKVVNRWMVLCMDHSMLVTSHNLETALSLSAHPLAWCESCQDMEPTPQEQGVVDQGQANLEAMIAEQEAYDKLTPKGKHFMRLVGSHFFDFFDDGIVANSGNWGENMAAQAYTALGVKPTSMPGIMNGTLKAGMWFTSKDDGNDGDFWYLTELGAAVARYAATQS